jgi:prepilin-type N-terminal cleavage/methylation domain-containing protein
VNRRDDSAGSAGFTLLEVMVALTVGGMALAVAVALLAGLGDRATGLAAAARRVDREANAERLLRALTANLQIGSDSTGPFRGDSRSAAFRSWCDAPSGWLERCAVRVSLEPETRGLSLILRLAGPDTTLIRMRSGIGIGTLRYLVDAANGGRWADRWSGMVPPAAMQVIADRDTLFLTVRSGG